VSEAHRKPARLQTADGLTLEAEWAAPSDPRATAVLCHPHPQYGGTMRSIVISALFSALPERGVACLRFNFRGVEGSEGAYSEGEHEPLDVRAALDAAYGPSSVDGPPALTGPPALIGPLALIGWSFGADMALTIDDARIAGWVGIAPPLRFRPERAYDAVGHDPRPKLLVLAANDEFRTPAEIEGETRTWTSARTEIVAGASHFFVGRTERVTAVVADFVDELVAGR
jgi:alpha/beta superfamily hydrolase